VKFEGTEELQWHVMALEMERSDDGGGKMQHE